TRGEFVSGLEDFLHQRRFGDLRGQRSGCGESRGWHWNGPPDRPNLSERRHWLRRLLFPEGHRRFHYDQRTAWRPVQLTKGSPASKRGAEKSIFAFDPGNALGLARQENCGLGAYLQTKHRRHTLLR